MKIGLISMWVTLIVSPCMLLFSGYTKAAFYTGIVWLVLGGVVTYVSDRKAFKIAFASLLYIATVVAAAIHVKDWTNNFEITLTAYFVGFVILGWYIDYVVHPEHHPKEGDIDDF
ncbi:MAG: hypothetical protein Q7S28_00515 [bacterium]|nr:hypothetical protein [bacterium]